MVMLREKIGQMLILGFEGKAIGEISDIEKAILQENLGGVILFDYDVKTKRFDKNIKNPLQVKKLNEDLQKITQDANQHHKRLNIPLFISVDYEGGMVNRLKEEKGFAKTLSPQLVAQLPLEKANILAHQMAKTLKTLGFNLNYAPLLDVNINPQSPAIGKLGRSFSDSPQIVVNYARVMAKAMKNQNIGYVFKHFPGHGSAKEDSHHGFVDVSTTWRNKELIPYKNLLDDDAMVMTAHIINRNMDSDMLPATLSRKIVSNVLRQELGFDGLIISDDMQMKAISDNYGLEQALVLAINAGVDVFIFGNQLTTKPMSAKKFIDIVEQEVNRGSIKQSTIEQSFRRIVAQKKKLSRGNLS
jgi:beta-N-acetylhexosaminidase